MCALAALKAICALKFINEIKDQQGLVNQPYLAAVCRSMPSGIAPKLRQQIAERIAAGQTPYAVAKAR